MSKLEEKNSLIIEQVIMSQMVKQQISNSSCYYTPAQEKN